MNKKENHENKCICGFVGKFLEIRPQGHGGEWVSVTYHVTDSEKDINNERAYMYGCPKCGIVHFNFLNSGIDVNNKARFKNVK